MTKCGSSASSGTNFVAIAVIAGAGPGLGFSLAKRFSLEYKVVLLSRTQEKLDRLANEIKKNGGEVISPINVPDIRPLALQRI